jgi:hypothetical protein
MLAHRVVSRKIPATACAGVFLRGRVNNGQFQVTVKGAVAIGCQSIL